MSDRAVVEATFEGADKVAKDARKVGDALKDAKSSAEKSGKATKDAGKEIKGLGGQVDEFASSISARALLGGVIGGAVLGAVNAGVNYLREGAKAAEDFQDRTAKLGRRAGVDLGGLREHMEGIEKETLQSVDAQEQYVLAVSGITGDTKSAIESLRAMSEEARASGRSLGELVGRSAALRDGLGVVGDQTDALGELRDVAERLGTVGGPEAFKRTIEAIAPALQQVSIESDASRRRVVAFLGELTKGMKPAQAAAVGSAAINAIKARRHEIKILTGKDAVNELGEVTDLPGTYQALVKRVQRSTSNKTAQRRILGKFLGSEDLAAAALRGDIGGTDDLARQIGDQGKTRREARESVASTEGRREAQAIREAQRQRNAGAEVLPLQDRAVAAKERFYSSLGEAGSTLANMGTEPPPPPAAPSKADEEANNLLSSIARDMAGQKEAFKDAIKDARFTVVVPRNQNENRGN